MIGSDYFASNYDPHVWFNINYFRDFAAQITEVLSEKDPTNSENYKTNYEAYLGQLNQLELQLIETINTLQIEKRILR